MNISSRLIGYITARGIKRAIVINSRPNRHIVRDEKTGVTLILTDARIAWINS